MNTRKETIARPPSYVETKRLLLRAPSLEDALGLMALASGDEPFARSTVGNEPNTLEGACTAIVRMLTDRSQRLGAWWVVAQKSDHRIVGLAGRSARLDQPGLLATFASEAAGRGYASEAIQALSGFDLRGLEREENLQSRSVPSASWYWRSRTDASASPTSRCA